MFIYEKVTTKAPNPHRRPLTRLQAALHQRKRVQEQAQRHPIKSRHPEPLHSTSLTEQRTHLKTKIKNMEALQQARQELQ